MKHILLVGLGGFIGSVGRYKLSGLVLHHTTDWRFPLGTFLVNVIGCLLIGVISGCAVKHSLFSTDARIFLMTGILGGFTTFSAFGYETFALIRRGENGVAFVYVGLSVVCGLLLLWLGFKIFPGGNPNS